MELVLFVALLAVGYGAGRFAESRHFAGLRRREAATRHLPVVTARRLDDAPVAEARLVAGSAVISIDYFKLVSASLRMLVGGRVGAYETLLDRARREAVLRMKEQALAAGADLVAGMRIETANIGQAGGGQKGVVAVEAVAYGTAVRHAPSP